MTQALGLLQDGLRQSRQRRRDPFRQTEPETNRLRNESDEDHLVRHRSEEPCGIEQVGDPDLMRRESEPDGRQNVLSFESNERTRRIVGPDGIDEQQFLRVLEERQQRHAQGSPVDDGDTISMPLPLQ